MLEQLAQDLLHDPATIERAERLKVRVLRQPQLVTTATSLWKAFARRWSTRWPTRRDRCVDAVSRLARFADSLLSDAALRERLDRRAADLAVFVVGRYGNELTTVISHTIDRWDGKEAARRIEAARGPRPAVHPDERTIVGGLVGLLIHTVSVLPRPVGDNDGHGHCA